MCRSHVASAAQRRHDLLGEALELVEWLLVRPEDERVEAELAREAPQRLDPLLGGPFSRSPVGVSLIVPPTL